MRFRDSMTRSFRVVDADWPRERTLDALARFTVPYIVVRRRDAETAPRLYYVFGRAELMQRLTQAQTADVREALGLQEDDAAPTVPMNAAFEKPKRAQVVLGEHGPAGLVFPAELGETQEQAREAAALKLALEAESAAKNQVAAFRATRSGGSSDASPRRTRGGARAVPPASFAAPPSPAASGPAPAEAGQVTRHLIGDLPSSVVAGANVSLLVSLASVASAGAAAAPLAVRVGTRIDIVVKPMTGLSLAGPSEGTLEVSDPQLDQPIQFKLTAGLAGPASVCIYAFCNGASVTKLQLDTTIIAAGSAVAPQRVPESASITIEPRAQPDLSMYIFERGNELSFHLKSADGSLEMNQYGPTRFASSPREHFRSFFGEIENLPLTTPTQRKVAKRRLEAKGANLFNIVFPDDLKVLLWELRDRIQTVQITSDEPWIPWEVCRLTGKTAGRIEEGKFLAEAYSVTRWLTGVSAAPRLRFNNWAVVVPGDSQLSQAPEEKGYVMSLAGSGRKITEVAAEYLELTEAMATGQYDAWHFTGHARADDNTDADQSVIELANHEKLRPEDVVGDVENVLLPRPFVFLNACQSAQGGMSLTGVGGWAQRFLKPNSKNQAASAFVGSYWSVFDDAACGFAKALYQGLLARKPIGQVAREARLAIRAQEDPTWLAYTVYADPYATIE